ncbi:MAG: CaiB/BaiF CoA transferase family protein [Hyphomicrobiales bacterium]
MNFKAQPLSGLKVLDFSTLLPGPMAGLLLAEAGAEVVKIERPGSGEEIRHYHPKWGRDSAIFAMLNRGKKSLALDLKDSRQIAMLEPLLADVDVLIEQFRPGVMERLGLGYKAVSALNPKLIYCSITGYGQTGPKADLAGHDINYIGDTGLLSLSLGQSDNPTVPPVLAADLAGGSYPAVMNILLALMHRQNTGRGTHLDIAMTDNIFMLMTWAQGQAAAADMWPESSRELLTGGSPRYQIYPTQDGRFIAAGPLEQKFWENFCRIIELEPEYHDDRKDPAAVIARVRELIASKRAGDWRRLFYGEDCCCSIVATLQEAFNDQHFAARGLFDHVLRNEDGAEMPATPVSVVPQFRTSPDKPKHAPSLAANNDEFLNKQ